MAVTVATVRLKSWIVFFSAVRNPFKAFIDWIENVSPFSFFQEKLDGEVSWFNVAVSSLCGLMAESYSYTYSFWWSVVCNSKIAAYEEEEIIITRQKQWKEQQFWYLILAWH